jgi:hypothetical protein
MINRSYSICIQSQKERQHLHSKLCILYCRLRPYHVEYTSSRPITEVKQRRARLVLGWVTAWEYRVS